MPQAPGRFLLSSLLVAVLAGLLFLPGLPGAFVFDDVPNIVNNEAVHLTRLDADALHKAVFSPQLSGSMRVLPTLSFAFDYWRAGGADPETFRITSIVIHALTACLLAGFFRNLLLISGVQPERVRWAAPALALAWAAHPLHVSSVLYVVQRIQTMGTLFLVLALLTYLAARQAQIEGRSGRKGMLLTVLLWFAALGCKEDSVLLPVYTLALEMTVLRFAATDARLARNLRHGYMLAALAGAAAFALLVVPHFWQWAAYPGRDFSTMERLLTQGRVLCMYLWQIVWPVPQHMPFYYDWLQPSRGLLHPWTTLPAIALLLGLLIVAWRSRQRWPLFALGVFLFFGSHFIGSNVVGLELAFEHRNHFALVGAVLALGCTLAYAGDRLRMPVWASTAACSMLLLGVASATLMRAHDWRGKLELAQTSTTLAPHSARAWISLCSGYFQEGGGAIEKNPFLDDAIKACTTGAAAAPYALNSPALLIVLKTLRGDVSKNDWTYFQHRLETVSMTFDNRRAPQILTHHALNGVKLDKQELLRALSTLARRAPLKPAEIASIGNFVMNDLSEPDLAMPYFIRAIEAAPPYDMFAPDLASELKAKGRPDLAKTIERLIITRSLTPTGRGETPARH